MVRVSEGEMDGDEQNIKLYKIYKKKTDAK